MDEQSIGEPAESPGPREAEALHPTQADWILLAMRGLLAVVLFLQIWLFPLPMQQVRSIRYVLYVYGALILIEALFLWRRWILSAWPPVTLALDILLVLGTLFMSGGAISPLLPIILLPVLASSVRLGFSSGLGLNLAALAGYVLLVMRDAFAKTPGLDTAQLAALGGMILTIGTIGGLLAEQIALPAKQDIHRYEERIKQLRDQHSAATARAQVFYEMSRTLSVTMSYQRVLEGVLQGCRRLLDFTTGVVLLSASPDSLFLAASNGQRVEQQREINLVGGALSTCLATADPLLIRHLGRDAELQQVLALQKCRSGLCVPLRAGLRNYGVIVIGALNEDAYDESDLSQLAALSHFATIAIQNAQLYQDLREERDKIISAEENVRKELSRDLHDGPAQSLAAIAMNVELIKRLLADSRSSQAIAELDSLQELARKTAWDVRTMLFELRPIILETKGLVPTLEQYVQRFPETEEPRVHLDTGNFNRRLNPKTETTVFTIMQEAVNNARKHAKAKNIWLRLVQQGSDLMASVQDDGVGFDLEKVKASYEKRGSFGLLNMHERAQLVGGRTEIRSAPGRGTAVIITVPLEREN